jgi:hypothetical protein
MIQPQTVVFTIPLKSRSACTDWAFAQANLRRTIRSIRAASGGDQAIVTVACHEPPELGAEAYAVEVLTVPFSPPEDPYTERLDGGRDKVRKRRFAAAWLRQELQGEDVYVMFLDADDLIHRDLLAHVLEHGRESYLIDKGYLFDTASGLLWKRTGGFHQICGSSLVYAFHPEELPSTWEDESTPFASFGSNPYQRGHQEYDLVATELGRPPTRLPFPAVVYLANHGESSSNLRTGVPRYPTAAGDLVWPGEARSILHEGFGAPDLAIASVRRTTLSLLRTAARRARSGAARREKPQRRSRSDE